MLLEDLLDIVRPVFHPTISMEDQARLRVSSTDRSQQGGAG